MSYEIRAFCRPVCDQPGCDAMVEDMDVNWFSDTGYAEDVAAEWDWQTIGDDVMRTRHYCPLHIHAKCAQCGRREILDRRTLENIGWEELDDMECTLCPDCANQPDTTIKKEH